MYKKAIDCFACHVCHFKSNWCFDEWQPASRYTVFIRLPHVLSACQCHGLTCVSTDKAGMNHCRLPLAGLECCRATVVLLSHFHPASPKHSRPHYHEPMNV